MARFFYTLAQILWGLPQTAAGFAIFLAHIRQPHVAYHGAIVTPWKSAGSVSLGLFIFLGGEAGQSLARGTSLARALDDPAFRYLLVHEYGHTIQSLIFGPLYLFVVGIPSVLWGYLPRLRARRQVRGTSYYDFVTERSANALGRRFARD